MVKTNPKRTLERSVLRWGLQNWWQIGWAIWGGYILWNVRTFMQDFETMGDRFMETTKYLHDKMEAHDAPLGDLPSDRPATGS